MLFMHNRYSFGSFRRTAGSCFSYVLGGIFMTIENLHCFVALAKELNFTKAAQRSHITQAAMSRKISSIEDELGIRLLDRNRHTVSLTLAGQSLFEQIQPILEDYENTISRVQNIAHGVYDTVQVGIGIYEHQLLAPVMELFLKENPIAQINFVQYKYRELVEQFNRGNLDLIISSDQYFDLITVDNTEKFLIHNNPWVLALNKNNPLSQHDSVNLSDLSTQNIITMYRNSVSALTTTFRGRFQPTSADYVNSHETKLLLVNANRGVGFIPEFVDVHAYPDIVTRNLTPYYRPRCFYAVIKKDSPNMCAHRLAEMLYEYYRPSLWMRNLSE